MVENTLSDIADQIRQALIKLNISERSALLEARELACFAAGVDRRDYFRLKNEKTGELVHPVEELLKLRSDGMPVAQIIGEWDFFGRTFVVDNRVLIPRDDSAAVVELLLSKLVTVVPEKAPKILDLCAGSGCLGITAALELNKNATVVLADISDGALEIASKNIVLHGLEGAVSTVKADVFSPPRGFDCFDAVICNPPYVRSGDISLLDDSIVKYEPMIALVGGDDGLAFYREICSAWKDVLVPGGLLCFEVGIGQAKDVSLIMEQNGFEKITVKRDLSGIDRALCGNKKA